MLSFFTKPIDKITFTDIQDLVNQKIPESSVLDYKAKMIGSDTIGKLMAAFANGSGGTIMLGVNEEKEDNKNTGKPDQIIGVKKYDYVNQITSIALSQTQPAITPRINNTITLPTNPSKYVVIIKIEPSLKPIMWNNTWPVRVNDQTVLADNALMQKIFNKEKYTLAKRL